MSLNDAAENLLELQEISVKYKSKLILDKINLSVGKGDIHAVVGSHGSGKSTLVKVISGIVGPAAGRMRFNGRLIEKYNAEKAKSLGIYTLHQNISLVQNLSVLQNIFLNCEIRKLFIFADKKRMREKAEEILKLLPVNIKTDDKIYSYKFSDQQWIEIAKMLCFHSKLIIIDEVSDRMDNKNIELFHHVLSLLRNEGATILYFANDINQISNFATVVSIINEGRILNTVNISSIDKLKLVQLTYTSLASRAQLESYNMELLYAQQMNKYALNSIPLPIFVSDSRDNVILVNRMMENLFSLKSRDLENRNTEVIKSMLGMTGGGNGNLLTAIPFYDDDNAFLGNVNIINNKNGYLAQSISDYLKRTPLMDRLSGIAHEINNPLGTIQNYVRIVQGSKSLDFIQKNMKIIGGELKRIKRIIKKNLDEHAEMRDEDYAEEKKSLKDIIENILLVLDLDIKKNSIAVEARFAEHTVFNSDSDMITQVILNIVTNGIEAMPSGGALTVETGNIRKNNTDYLTVSIGDTGKGVPDHIKEEIFKPFFTTKKSDESRGLGLSLCRDLLSRMDGTVEVRDNEEKGRGALFLITFP